VSVTKYYDDMINQIKDDTEYNKKKKLYLTLISINILEGIRFYVSFACSYCFAQNKKMEGNAKIIGLINRDENLHMGFTTQILKILNENKEEGFQDVIKDCNDIVLQMYKDAANEEME
jgi:ribonucleoside-diphosphate reductase beta chain